MAERYKRAVFAARFLHEAGRHTGKWYAGITDDPPARLFVEHAVHAKRGDYAWAECANDGVARDAEQMLLDAGYDGGLGGGTRATRFVYVYRKSTKR